MKILIEDFTVLASLGNGLPIESRVIRLPVVWDEEVREWLVTLKGHNLINSTKHQMLHELRQKAKA